MSADRLADNAMYLMSAYHGGELTACMKDVLDERDRVPYRSFCDKKRKVIDIAGFACSIKKKTKNQKRIDCVYY